MASASIYAVCASILLINWNLIEFPVQILIEKLLKFCEPSRSNIVTYNNNEFSTFYFYEHKLLTILILNSLLRVNIDIFDGSLTSELNAN